MEAREAGLLGRIAVLLRGQDLLGRVPDGPRRHLDGAAAYAAKHRADVLNEIAVLRDVVKHASAPVVVMKGAAYAVAELPAADGRIFQDIDLLVPSENIREVEQALTEAGWTRPELSAHDRRYYYEWMHQIPPLTHPERGSTVDVHHNIVPPMVGPRVDPSRLLSAAEPSKISGVFRLSFDDLILHSAVHLLNEGEFERGLRDVSDLDLLLRDRMTSDPYLAGLSQRARELDLLQPMVHALWLTRTTFDTPIPAKVDDALKAHRHVVGRTLAFCYRKAVVPGSCGTGAIPRAARFVLYVRSHLLKMPPRILLPHVFMKSRPRKPPAAA
jgi:hypothetical protein